MPTLYKRDPLVLDEEQIRRLQAIQSSRNVSRSTLVRARILLKYARGDSISEIARGEGVTRPTVQLCIDKALTGGIETAIRDLSRPGRPSSIIAEDKAWVMHLACSKPPALEYDGAELWTLTRLTAYIQKHAMETGHFSLEGVQKATIRRIVKESSRSPHNVAYYFDKRSLEYGGRVANVFAVFKDIELLHETGSEMSIGQVRTAYRRAEGSDIQIDADITADLVPEPNSHPCWFQNYERERVGTVSLLAGIDLYDGRVIGMVRDKCKARRFIEFLEIADGYYPPNWHVRIVLGNCSSDVSRESMKALKVYPNRFEFIYVQKNESWLNLVDVFFTRMTRSFLRSIRVKSKAEFINRINEYVEEINLFTVSPT